MGHVAGVIRWQSWDRVYRATVDGKPAELIVSVRRGKPPYVAHLYLDADFLGSWPASTMREVYDGAAERIRAGVQ
jgi:hypothetical protein